MSILTESLEGGINNELNKIPFAYRLLDFIKKNGEINERNLSDLAKVDLPFLPERESFPNGEKNIKDRRIKRILLRGIRKFPAEVVMKSETNNKDSERKVYYSIDLGDNPECKSTVILGSNGVGKSSIYTALEKACLNFLFSAAYRGYSDDSQQTDYLLNINIKNEKPSIIIEFNSGKRECYSADKTLNPYSYPAFFCMEYDINKLTKSLDAEYVAEQLGISDFYNLVSIFTKIKNSYQENNDDYSRLKAEERTKLFSYSIFSKMINLDNIKIKKLVDLAGKSIRIFNKPLSDIKSEYSKTILDLKQIIYTLFSEAEFNEIISTWPNKNELLTSLDLKEQDWNSESIAEIIDSLKKFNEQICKDILRSIRINRNDSITKNRRDQKILETSLNITRANLFKIKNDAPICGISANAYNQFTAVANYLSLEYKKSITPLLDCANIIFPILMTEYFDQDIQDINLQMTDDNTNIKVNILTKNPIKEDIQKEYPDPRKYLNTFRFKVYCVALKIALAFTCSKIYGINSPIVIDDVFDSSDFSNREKIQHFICHIFNAHEAIFNNSIHLQLLFFTQDDVIGDAVYKGITYSNGRHRSKYQRLYNYTEVTDKDKKNESIMVLDGDNSLNTYEIVSYKIDQKIR